MENLACQTLKKEIVEARERVFTKQREYEEKIGMKAPVELQKRVFNILFRVSQKLDSFDITKNLKDNGLDFLNPKLNKKSIIKQMESLIDMISKEYYYDIAEIIDGYVFSNFKSIKEDYENIYRSIMIYFEYYNTLINNLKEKMRVKINNKVNQFILSNTTFVNIDDVRNSIIEYREILNNHYNRIL